MAGRFIEVVGARQNNLKDVSVRIPIGAVTAVTGVAGAGKSSLALDVLYAEGHRRYAETFSPYARQFLERLDRPRAERIEGVLPAIAVDRTAPVRTSRSTVSTMTSVADYLRALYARAAVLHCRQCGEPVRRDTPSSIVETLVAGAPGQAALVTFPHRVGRKVAASAWCAKPSRRPASAACSSEASWSRSRRRGSTRRTASSRSCSTASGSRPASASGSWTRSRPRCGTARARLAVHVEGEAQPRRFSAALHCASCDIGYSDPSPALFSFNHPVGACETCKGFGRTMAIDPELVIPDPRRTLAGGAVKPFQTNFDSECQDDLERYLKRAGLPEDVPYADLPQDVKRFVWEGEPGGRESWKRKWYGVTGFFEWLESRTYRMHVRVFLSRYRSYRQCHDCGGARLRAEARLFRLDGRTLPEVEALPVAEAERAFREWDGRSQGAPLDAASEQVLYEIRGRLRFLVDVGLGYLTLGRQSRTLSGGEAQRVTLATALGGSLTSTLYVLDEPSVGLHARDASPPQRGAAAARGRGQRGGRGRARARAHRVGRPRDRPRPRPGPRGRRARVRGGGRGTPRRAALGHRGVSRRTAGSARARRRAASPIRSARCGSAGRGRTTSSTLTLDLPLGLLVCVTGVSGSGKSSLVDQVLYRNLRRQLRLGESEPGACDGIDGAAALTGVTLVDQTPARRVLARQRGDLHGRPRAAAQGLRPHARGARARPQADRVLVQLRGRGLPRLRGRGLREGRAAVPARRVREVRGVRRPALPARGAGGARPRPLDRGRARPAGGRRGAALRRRQPACARRSSRCSTSVSATCRCRSRPRRSRAAKRSG